MCYGLPCYSTYQPSHSLAINAKLMAMGGPLGINQVTLVTPSNPHKEPYLHNVINWGEIMSGQPHFLLILHQVEKTLYNTKFSRALNFRVNLRGGTHCQL